mgnify:CR=1 FL=1
MNHWQRLFTYLTGAIVIGLLLIILTHGLLHYVNKPDLTGYIALLAYGIVYLNLGYGVNRRFVLKSDAHPAVNYLMSFLMTVPTMLWIFTKDEGLGNSLFLFTATILFAVFLGTYVGIQRGITKRKALIRQMYKEEGRELPEDLKRPHDDLSKN